MKDFKKERFIEQKKSKTNSNIMYKPISIILLLLIILLYACNDINHHLLSQETYYSPLNNGMIFFNFTDDSLFFYNSETNKKGFYKTKYTEGEIVINKNKINVVKKNDKIIFIDKKHFFINNDTIILKEIKLNEKINKNDLNNKYWFKNFVKQDISQSIWYYFKEKNKVDIYLSNNMDTSYYSHSYNIIKLGNHRIVNMPFFFEKKSFFVKKITNDKLILFTHNNFTDSTFQMALTKYKEHEQISPTQLYKTWVKIDSINAFELPHKLIINKNQILTSNDTVFYELGLNNKYLLFEKGYESLVGYISMIKINKLTKDTLILERKSRLGKEAAVYKTLSIEKE